MSARSFDNDRKIFKRNRVVPRFLATKISSHPGISKKSPGILPPEFMGCQSANPLFKGPETSMNIISRTFNKG